MFPASSAFHVCFAFRCEPFSIIHHCHTLTVGGCRVSVQLTLCQSVAVSWFMCFVCLMSAVHIHTEATLHQRRIKRGSRSEAP